MASAPSVRAGSLPFGVLSLLGRPVAELPGRSSWAPEPVPPGAPPGAERYVYEAEGDEDGRPVPIVIRAHVVDGRVAAIAVASPEHLTEVGALRGRGPSLVATRRPARQDRRLVNWIGIGERGPVNLGLAF